MTLNKLFFRWFPVVVRALVVYTRFTPALNKFTQTEQIVGFFTALGIPSPEIMVTGALSPFQPEGDVLGRFRYRVRMDASQGSTAAA